MAEIKTKSGFIILVDDQDVELVSQFTWWPHFGRHKHLTPYAVSKAYHDNTYTRIYMHRLIMQAPDGVLVDHVNGNGLDNRRSNLRFANKSLNAVNRHIPVSKVGFRGVDLHGRLKDGTAMYRARVGGGHNTWHGPRRLDPVQAARDYDAEAYQRYGEFARLNFPQERAA